MNKNLLLVGLGAFVAYRIWQMKMTNEQPVDNISLAADKTIWAGADQKVNTDLVDSHYTSNLPSASSIEHQMANEEETMFAGAECMC